MARLFAAALLVWSLAGPALAASLDAAAINNAEYRARPKTDNIDPAVVKVQVLLDRALFSPGEIDGKLGREHAKGAPGICRGQRADIRQDDHAAALGQVDGEQPRRRRQPVHDHREGSEGALPAQASGKNGGYEGAAGARLHQPARGARGEIPHERSVCWRPSIPERSSRRQARRSSSPPCRDAPAKLNIGRVEVDKARQTVKAFDPNGALLAFFPATVGSEEKPTPSGTLKVTSVDANPNYRYNPDYKFKGVRSKQPFTIKPGPNNPVGVYWIGLSAEGYGIHGTPEPSKVSKSESHGCVRLTNWDVAWLGGSIKKGTPVEFLERTPTDKSAQR